jgi:hypothetical protein
MRITRMRRKESKTVCRLQNLMKASIDKSVASVILPGLRRNRV